MNRICPARKEQNTMKTSLLFSEEQVQAQVKDLAKKINSHYGKQEVLVVGILKGAYMFFSDLIRHFQFPSVCDFCSLSFYGDQVSARNEAQLSLDISQPIKDKHVLIVDCIADCGHSLEYIRRHITSRNPKSLASVCLVVKPKALKKVPIEFSGFHVDQEAFIIGYGVDYKNEGRHLPHLEQLKDLN